MLRQFLVFLQAVSILITWPLWQTRKNPPTLPAFDALPQLDLGFVLLASLALILWRPTLGVVVHLAAILIAVTLDQTRLQPEFVSMAILLIGTTDIPYSPVIARAHLVALWFWAGVNKALSTDFMSDSAQWLFEASMAGFEPLEPYFGWIVIVSEISIAVLVLVPRLRNVGVMMAVALHFLTLVSLVGVGWNESVWPWNVALMMAAPGFFLLPSNEAHARKGASEAIFVVFLLMPVGFYAGYVDAYVAHNLYTSNTARAEVCRADGSCSDAVFEQTWTELSVPLPPEPRLFIQFFNQLCSPTERLIVQPRRTQISFGRDTNRSEHACPEGS